jgi:hypothetical protein
MKSSSAVAFALVTFALLGGCGGGSDGESEPSPENCSTAPAADPGDEGEYMRPGGNCISCHQEEGEGPRYTVAGTVMGDYLDDDDCEGIDGVVVELTGADGNVISLDTNEVGNFFYEGELAKPYTARVLDGDTELVMEAAQNDGNCMNCHSSLGAAGSPGRIVSP